MSQKYEKSRHSEPVLTDPKLNLDEVPISSQSLEELLLRYADVFELSNFLEPVRHKTKMHIKTEGSPVCGRTRRLSPECLEILDRELQKLLSLGIIVPAVSLFRSPLHMVPKMEPGECRITGDYRDPRKQTVPDKYAIPFLTNFTDFMYRSCVFSSLDLYKSYHQIEIAEEDIEKTTILPLGEVMRSRERQWAYETLVQRSNVSWTKSHEDYNSFTFIICGIVGIMQNQSIMLLTNHLLQR